MRPCRLFICACFLVLVAFSLARPVSAQQQPPTANQPADVVKVDTALVQTDITVFDRNGNFVDDLKRDQFLLKVDGKPRDILFFERITAGSRNEDAQLAAARGTRSASLPDRPLPLDRGRVVLFFVDDIHLSPGSLKQTRSLLTRFVDRQMTQNDEAAIVSATGQIGFLQQLTDNKTVLRKAIERLGSRNYNVRDTERPPMSVYQAELINANDQDVLGYFADPLVREGVPRPTAERIVQARANSILAQSSNFARASLSSLQSLVRTARELPGRKLLVFISDGFYLHHRSSDNAQRLRELTTQAAEAAVVIYSIDARGLFASLEDPTSPGNFDPTGRLQRTGGEIMASQDALNSLAADTGGRALFNTNDLSRSVTTALKETSTYYLLAWRPGPEEQNSKSRRLQVSINGRPEYSVRFRRAFNEGVTAKATSAAKVEPTFSSGALRAALSSFFPKSDLPVHVALNFVHLRDRGTMLSQSMEVTTESLKFEMLEGKPSARLIIAGLVLDENGKTVNSFNKTVTVRATLPTADAPPKTISYTELTPIKPGLYQVRVAAVDEKQRQSGSASEWIQIPDLQTKALTLSSLVVAEKAADQHPANASTTRTDGEPDVGLFIGANLSVDRRFLPTSRLRFVVYVYNATLPSATSATSSAISGSAQPDVINAKGSGGARLDLGVQVQVFRDDQPVITTPMQRLKTEGVTDVSSVPYAADVLLDELVPGHYVLRVTVIDRIAKSSASRDFRFQVD